MVRLPAEKPMTDSHAPVESAIPVAPHTKRERQLWMDLLRGLAILLVVAFHSVTILERHAYTAAPWMRDFNQLFVLYRMPTLVFLSGRSEEHTSELQSLMRISYAVFCLKKKKIQNSKPITHPTIHKDTDI